MPFVHLDIFGRAPTDAEVASLQQEITALMVQPLRKKAELTVVAVQASAARVSRAGRALPPHEWTAQLTAFVTAGTNTEEEKALFQREAHALLARHFGEPSAPLYVIVQEVAGTDWGFGGRSQAARARAALAT